MWKTTTLKLFTKKTCIDFLKACKFMHHFEEIQAQILIHGHHQNIDVLHKLISFSAATNLAHAEKIFDRIENPTLFIFNVMIKAHVKAGCFRKAIHLFDELRLQGLLPDNYTHPFVFKAFGGLGAVLAVKNLHGFAVKTGIVYDCYVCNSALDMYGEMGCVDSLSKLFEEMPLRDLVSWNVLINGFVKCSRFEDAIGAYVRMGQEGCVDPDEATVVSTLSACTALKRLDIGSEIHGYVSKELGFTSIIGNALLDMYGKCGRVDMARTIFDGMLEKNVICWTSMVSAHVNCGQLDEARSLFERSPVKDNVLWTAMINGYVQFNKVDEAMTLFREMQINRVKPDKYTLVSLLTGCAQLGSLEQGEWIHTYLENNRILIDATVGTALIEMYAKCGCLDKSLKIFYNLNLKDAKSWTSIICALAMNGNASKALQMFSEMIQDGIKPDHITFIGVLSACSHGGLVDEGRRHFDSMNKIYEIEPMLEHYACLVDLLGRAGLLDEAEDVITKIPSEDKKILVPLYCALLGACMNHGNISVGERIAKRILKMNSSDSSNQTLLANIYASASRWDDVTKVKKAMAIRGRKKVPGCSVIL